MHKPLFRESVFQVPQLILYGDGIQKSLQDHVSRTWVFLKQPLKKAAVTPKSGIASERALKNDAHESSASAEVMRSPRSRRPICGWPRCKAVYCRSDCSSFRGLSPRNRASNSDHGPLEFTATSIAVTLWPLTRLYEQEEGCQACCDCQVFHDIKQLSFPE